MQSSAVAAVFTVVAGLVAVALVLAVLVGNTYNRMVRLDQQVQAAWAQVENVYQRRADLVPNLVATVRGAAEFEREVFTEVAAARAEVGQVSAAATPANPEEFAAYDQAQQQLGSALSRLIAVAEAYPTLQATQAFRDLQVQLEGTENRIAVERMRYNEAARAFNTARQQFPTVMIAGLFGERFDVKPFFTAEPGAATAPEVRF